MDNNYRMYPTAGLTDDSSATSTDSSSFPMKKMKMNHTSGADSGMDSISSSSSSVSASAASSASASAESGDWASGDGTATLGDSSKVADTTYSSRGADSMASTSRSTSAAEESRGPYGAGSVHALESAVKVPSASSMKPYDDTAASAPPTSVNEAISSSPKDDASLLAEMKTLLNGADAETIETMKKVVKVLHQALKDEPNGGAAGASGELVTAGATAGRPKTAHGDEPDFPADSPNLAPSGSSGDDSTGPNPTNDAVSESDDSMDRHSSNLAATRDGYEDNLGSNSVDNSISDDSMDLKSTDYSNHAAPEEFEEPDLAAASSSTSGSFLGDDDEFPGPMESGVNAAIAEPFDDVDDSNATLGDDSQPGEHLEAAPLYFSVITSFLQANR